MMMMLAALMAGELSRQPTRAKPKKVRRPTSKKRRNTKPRHLG